MPLPLLFIGLAAATGSTGIGASVKSVSDKKKAKKIVELSNKKVSEAGAEVEKQRELVKEAFDDLGGLKSMILSSSIVNFLDTFSKIKNVDFRDSVGLDELSKLHLDQVDFDELKLMSNQAVELTKGMGIGSALGGLTAYGAYGAANAFALASTGTAISTLSGAAATNATLAFFGGGSIASGGLGMAAGQAILGGIAVGPALLVMGVYAGVKSQEELDKALSNKAEADETVEELNTIAFQCSAIRRRTYMFYSLLSRLDHQYIDLLDQMNTVVSNEGYDFSKMSKQGKSIIRMTAAHTGTIKAVLDTPILSEDGSLTEESQKAIENRA